MPHRPIEVRRLAEPYVPAVAELRIAQHTTTDVAFQEADLRHCLASGEAQFLVAFAGPEPVGYVEYEYAEGGWVDSLFVREAARGRGAGRKLMTAALLDFADHQYEDVRLMVTASPDPSAIALYTSLGFTYVENAGHERILGTDLTAQRVLALQQSASTVREPSAPSGLDA